MSHKKCPISWSLLESIHGVFLFLFGIVHKSCLCTKFWIQMCKVSHLNFSLNTHFVVKSYLLWIPTSSCVIFIVVSLATPFGTSNFPMCHNILIYLKCTFSCLNHIFPLVPFYSCVSLITVSHWQCLLPHPTHHHKRHLSMAGISTTYQNNTSHGQSIGRQCLHPAAPMPPATCPH